MKLTRIPVRRGNGPLHIATPTGRGYFTACGRTLAGPNLHIPYPRINLGRAHLEAHWARCWALEKACKSCDKSAP